MEYNFLKYETDEIFIEIDADSFRTRIEFDWSPEEKFDGLAVGCNYNYGGHPLGLLKDNGLHVTKIDGNSNWPCFSIPETNTIIQAGPMLVENYLPCKGYGGFSATYIIAQPQCHIGKKKNGNYIIGFTRKFTFKEIVDKYIELNAESAIKLPGGNKGMGFHFKSRIKNIKEGQLPMPVALIFESPIQKLSHFGGEIS